jgi:hypothetical protein
MPATVEASNRTESKTDVTSAMAERSVADPGCLSRILIFHPSRIPDPTTARKEIFQ